MFRTGQSAVTEWMQLGIRTAMMMSQAQIVVGMRMMGWMGLWRVSPSENLRMIQEKTDAFAESGRAATRALAGGQAPIKVAEAALRPVARRTKNNVSRLARRGPGRPTSDA